jgi:FO synthase
MLAGGADDLGGTLMEETISRMAGSQHGSLKTVDELEEIAVGAGRPAMQRTTTYGEVPEARRLLAREATAQLNPASPSGSPSGVTLGLPLVRGAV